MSSDSENFVPAEMSPRLQAVGDCLHAGCKWLSAAGIAVFLVIIALTFLDVFLRYVFSRPMPGMHEVTEMLMPVVVFSSIAYAQWAGCHVVMDVITDRLSPERKLLFESVTGLWSVIICALCVYASFRYGSNAKSVTGLLSIPYKPFIYFVSFGFTTLMLTLLWEYARTMNRILCSCRRLLLPSLLISAATVALAVWLVTHKLTMFGFSSVQVGLLGLGVMFILFLSGMPIAYGLLATGFIFAASIRGVGPSLNFFGKALFSTSASYTWSPLMFFMLMGYFCFYSGLGKDLYTCARAWLGHLRGGLAQGSVCACTAFGAVVGDCLSGTIAMSAIALPEMRDNHYDDGLSVGTLASSGIIGALIPPSGVFILYGVLAEQSIAELFMAGVLPGLLSMLLFCFTVWLKVFLNPSLARPLPVTPLEQRMRSLLSALPILMLFIIVIGGIYGGMFTAAEGGAVGCMCTMLMGLFMRRLRKKNFLASLTDAAKYITMSFTVLTGASVLGYFMTLSRIPQTLAMQISGLGLSGGLTMTAILIVLFILGCFVPSLPLLLVCVPIFVPIAKFFQWDLVWFGVVIVMMMNWASITPPFGINLFVMKSVADVPLVSVFKACMPFVLAMLGVVVLVIIFPDIALWLPSMMY